MNITVNPKINTTWQDFIGKHTHMIFHFTFPDNEVVECNLTMENGWSLGDFSHALFKIRTALNKDPTSMIVTKMTLVAD